MILIKSRFYPKESNRNVLRSTKATTSQRTDRVLFTIKPLTTMQKTKTPTPIKRSRHHTRVIRCSSQSLLSSQTRNRLEFAMIKERQNKEDTSHKASPAAECTRVCFVMKKNSRKQKNILPPSPPFRLRIIPTVDAGFALLVNTHPCTQAQLECASCQATIAQKEEG